MDTKELVVVGTDVRYRTEGEDVVATARRDQRGMVSAEWAVGIIAAIAIAGVLLAVVTDGKVQDVLLSFILYVINSFTDIYNNR